MTQHRGSQVRVVIDSLESRRLMAAATASVDLAAHRQTVDGMGAAVMPYYTPPEYNNSALYDQLVNDLGTSAVRGPIWPNFEVANDNDDPNVFDWSKFDSRQLAHALQFNQQFEERGVKTFLLSVWSPPAWMKTSKTIDGGGFLRPDMRAEFAEFVAAAVIAAKRDFGIEVSAVSVQNEQFFFADYEQTVYDNLQLREAVLAVQAKFVREGLTTRIMANEDLGAREGEWLWYNRPLLEDDQIDKSRLVIGAHNTGAAQMPSQAAQLAGTGIPLWYSEISGISGATWDGGLANASDLSDAFTVAGANAYFHWQFTSGAGNEFFDGTTTSLMNDGVPNAKYHAVKHYYKYVRPGMVRVSSAVTTDIANPEHATRVAAFTNPVSGGATTIVILNRAPEATELTLNLSNLPAGTVFRAFRSTAGNYWQTQANVTPNAFGFVQLTLPAGSLLTLYSGADLAPITGVPLPPAAPIDQPVDAVRNDHLMLAVSRGWIDNVREQIAGGAPVNRSDPASGWTPLHAAAASVWYSWTLDYNKPNVAAILNELIAAGADVNARSHEGFTPLHAVAMNPSLPYNVPLSEKTKMVDALVAAGADVNARDNKGRTPLHWVAMMPTMLDHTAYYTFVAERLLARGADKTLKDDAGMTPYDYAVQEYRWGMTNLLSGPNLDTRPPTLRWGGYLRDRNDVSLTLTENVTWSLDAVDVTVTNLTTNTPVTGWSFNDLFSYGQTIARIHFDGRLPDGRYRVTIASGSINDEGGRFSTAPITYDFFSLAGDANGDARVDFDDLLVLAQNYGKSARTFSSGDFNEDGTVNFDDLLLLAQRYGTTLPAAPAAAVVASTSPARATTARRRG